MIKNLKNGWEVKKLCDVANIKSSKRIFADDYVDFGIPFYRSKEIGDLFRGENPKVELFISEDKFEKIKNKFGVPKKGDILLTSVGTIGNTWIVDDRDFYYKDGNITQIEVSKKLLNKYLCFYIRSDLFFQSIGKDISGTAYNALTMEKLKNLEIPLPPLEEQIKIAEILEKADNLRTKRKEANKLYDDLIQAIFIDMFGDLKKYTYVRLSELCNFITKGTTPKSNLKEDYYLGLIPFLKVYNITNDGKIDLSIKPSFIDRETHLDELKRSIVYPQDVLMNIVGPPLGKIGIVPRDFPEYNINQAIVIFRSNKRINPLYLLHTLKNRENLNRIIEQAVGIRQLNLSLEQCRNFEIPLPPIELQNKFAEIVEKIELMKEKAKKAEEEIENLFNALMQKAFNGGF